MNELRNIIGDTLRTYIEESSKLFRVIDSKYYYSNYKDNIFAGTYDDCVQYIINNQNMNLEILPIDSTEMKETKLNENVLAIIGSRSFNNYSYAKSEILKIIQRNKIAITKIISGGASGADKIAEIFASKFNIPIEVIVPDWESNKNAGVIRNTDIIKKSDYVIAFWDGKSKGTLDSINKAKRFNKKLFIINVSPEQIYEGVRVNGDGQFSFDFGRDDKSDILTLKYNKNFVFSKRANGIISYFSYKINKKIDKTIRFKLLTYVKNELQSSNTYGQFITKAILGLYNNPNFEIGDVDLILIPQSSSTLNLDVANRIKNKIPNALFSKDAILKNEPINVSIDYDALSAKKYDSATILAIEKMVHTAIVDGAFKIKKIPPRFRKYIHNFLKMDLKNRELLNRLVDGKVLVIDDYVSEGSTFREIDRLIDNYAPKEIILFSLIA